MTTIFRNIRLFDGLRREAKDGMTVVVVDDLIDSIVPEIELNVAGETIDCGGRLLMPGLIDAHVHIVATSVNLAAGWEWPSLTHTKARYIMEGMLQRGFTTVRDAGGADGGFVQAVEQGYIDGPRLVICGAALSQTGGHGDIRSRISGPSTLPSDRVGSMISRIADGVPEVRHASRDELRKGAHYLKIMASGGAASVSDPIENTQFSSEEIAAIVEEAVAWNTYVAAHAYDPRAISAAVNAGVRTIEHGNLIDMATATLMQERGAFLVPTLVASDVLSREASRYGFTEVSMRKISQVRDKGLESLKIAREAGVKIGFGTDLLDIALHQHQAAEFVLRAKVESPIDTLLSATGVNAEMMMMSGRIGAIKPGAFADLLVVDGDPLSDATVLAQHGETLSLIMKSGRIHKNRL
ncbi:MAG: amidohydrolase family protein [Rhizobiaceae bacterium]|nr:amidohydrolase family protein [Rhizobiaceae bacterium]